MCAVYQTLAPTYWQGSIAEPVSGAAQQQGRDQGRAGERACCRLLQDAGRDSRQFLASTCLDLPRLGLAWLQQCRRQCNHLLSCAWIYAAHSSWASVNPHWCHQALPRPLSEPRPSPLRLAALLDCGSNFDFSADAKFAVSLSLSFSFSFPLSCSPFPLLSLSLSHCFSFYLLY